jgi:3(or 17)beta-hydroxysteroid dehydrogenase
VTDRLKSKVALVTGAGQGIGKAIAHALSHEGAHVYVTDTKLETAEAVSKSIQKAGGQAQALKLDVSSEQEWIKAYQLIAKNHSVLNILVNNAAIEVVGPVEELVLKDWKAVQSVNVEGVFLSAKIMAPLLRQVSIECPQDTASMVNLSSVAGLIGRPDQLAYMTSKGAVRSMSKGLAIEFASKGYNIRVNSVHPGGIQTPMLESVLQYRMDIGVLNTKNLDEALDIMAENHPIGRIGTPNDIAQGVLYLASDESSFVTGTELIIDGGWTAQ